MAIIYRIRLSNPHSSSNPGRVSRKKRQEIQDYLYLHLSIIRFTLYKNELTLLLKEKKPDDDEDNESAFNNLIENIENDLGIECELDGNSEFIEYKEPELIQDSENEDHHDKHEKKQKPFYHLNHLGKGIVGIVWGVGLLILTALNLTLPFIALSLILGATTLATLYLGHEIYIKGIKKLIRTKKLNMNILYTISTLTIVVVSVVSFFVPGFPLILEAAPLILGLWHIGEEIEHSLKKKVHSNLTLQDSASKEIGWLNEGIEEKRSVKTIIPNDIIIVHGGEIIPLDGECLTEGNLYTTIVSGSLFSKKFNKGNPVLAGMRVEEGESIEIRVTQTFQHSYLSRLDQKIKDAGEEKAPIESFTDKVLQFFIPGLLSIAIISAVVIGILFTPALAIQCAIAVLVSACPCAPAFITPAAVKIGMNKTLKEGIQFKNGKSLQAAADIDVVVFDLNGTLTMGRPEVTGHQIYDRKIPEEEFFQLVTLLEKEVKHAVAKAIVHYSSERMALSVQPDSTEPDTSHHSGVQAVIDGKIFMIGNEDYMHSQGIHLSRLQKKPLKFSASTIYVASKDSEDSKGKVIGKIGLTDPIRPDAHHVINILRNQGKEIHICTGADKETAVHYGNLLGIPKKNIESNCVEEGERTKSDYISMLQNRGHKVAMIGDAGNDVIAITKSDCGIAIKSDIGSEMAQQQAGAVIQRESLIPIATAFKGAILTKRNIVQNLLISLTYNSLVTIGIVIFQVFLAGITIINPIFGLVLGIGLMIIETSAVILNAYHFSRQNISYAETIEHNAINEQPDDSPKLHVQSSFDRPKPSMSFANRTKPATNPYLIKRNLTFWEDSSEEEFSDNEADNQIAPYNSITVQ